MARSEAVDRPLSDGEFTCHRSINGDVRPIELQMGIQIVELHFASEPKCD